MDRWFAIEMGKLQQSIVRQQRHLGDVLAEERPQAETRGADPYLFDPAALRTFGEPLPLLTRHLLKVPIFFYADKEADNSVYVADMMAVEALSHHNLIPPGRVVRDGKLWLAMALAGDISRRYPTLFQFILQ